MTPGDLWRAPPPNRHLSTLPSSLPPRSRPLALSVTPRIRSSASALEATRACATLARSAPAVAFASMSFDVAQLPEEVISEITCAIDVRAASCRARPTGHSRRSPPFFRSPPRSRSSVAGSTRSSKTPTTALSTSSVVTAPATPSTRCSVALVSPRQPSSTRCMLQARPLQSTSARCWCARSHARRRSMGRPVGGAEAQA